MVLLRSGRLRRGRRRCGSRAVFNTLTERTENQALSAARAPVERGMTRLKSWQIFRRSRISPNRMSVITHAHKLIDARMQRQR